MYKSIINGQTIAYSVVKVFEKLLEPPELQSCLLSQLGGKVLASLDFFAGRQIPVKKSNLGAFKHELTLCIRCSPGES